MESLSIAVETNIPGVKPAEQARSRKLQMQFVEAGQRLLRSQRLDDFAIPDLAKEAGSSVGGFYSRFENKEVFFEFLRARMLAENTDAFTRNLDPDTLADADINDTARIFVDVMIEVFSGPWRGVLREAYARIPEKRGAWAPMRSRGGQLTLAMTDILKPKLGDAPDAAERIGFAIQMVFSVLNNELMNPNLQFSIGDDAFRKHLAAMFGGYLTTGR